METPPRATIQVELAQEINQAVARWGAQIIAIAVDQISIPDEVGGTLRRAWAAGWENKISFEKADTIARVLKRTAEGRRDAAELDRNARLIAEQAEVESQRLRAQANAAADRLKQDAQTESNLASIRLYLSVLKEHGISTDSPLAQKIFDGMNVRTSLNNPAESET